MKYLRKISFFSLDKNVREHYAAIIQSCNNSFERYYNYMMKSIRNRLKEIFKNNKDVITDQLIYDPIKIYFSDNIRDSEEAKGENIFDQQQLANYIRYMNNAEKQFEQFLDWWYNLWQSQLDNIDGAEKAKPGNGRALADQLYHKGLEYPFKR